jgi:hypothetical protein
MDVNFYDLDLVYFCRAAYEEGRRDINSCFEDINLHIPEMESTERLGLHRWGNFIYHRYLKMAEDGEFSCAPCAGFPFNTVKHNAKCGFKMISSRDSLGDGQTYNYNMKLLGEYGSLSNRICFNDCVVFDHGYCRDKISNKKSRKLMYETTRLGSFKYVYFIRHLCRHRTRVNTTTVVYSHFHRPYEHSHIRIMDNNLLSSNVNYTTVNLLEMKMIDHLVLVMRKMFIIFTHKKTREALRRRVGSPPYYFGRIEDVLRCITPDILDASVFYKAPILYRVVDGGLIGYTIFHEEYYDVACEYSPVLGELALLIMNVRFHFSPNESDFRLIHIFDDLKKQLYAIATNGDSVLEFITTATRSSFPYYIIRNGNVERSNYRPGRGREAMFSQPFFNCVAITQHLYSKLQLRVEWVISKPVETFHLNKRHRARNKRHGKYTNNANNDSDKRRESYNPEEEHSRKVVNMHNALTTVVNKLEHNVNGIFVYRGKRYGLRS